jgi:hypothetical protein
MARKKKLSFKLNPEWMLKEPLDFEYNKYTLLDYLQKCEKNYDNFELYPDFVEISLHLANIQSLVKENILLLTDKKFEFCDDEILVKDLYPKKLPNLSIEDKDELEKTINYSNGKLYDVFNTFKTIWNIAFDSIEINIKKNKGALISGSGYIFYYEKKTEKLFVWEYQIRNVKNEPSNNKTYLTKIYEDTIEDVTLTSIIEKHSKLNNTNYYKDLPVFEMKCSNQNFPMEQTIVPIMKRKIMSYIFQIINFEKTKDFDSES